MKTFNLPDLGEGLPDAEIVNWLVKVGDTVTVDQPMVEMETAKAVVEVPAPYAGIITQLHGEVGDIIITGAALVEFNTSANTSIVEKKKQTNIESKTETKTGNKPVTDTSKNIEIFNLPDLGEGLPDAEIVNWLIKTGETVELHQPMVEMETAKAVVEVPAPHAGIISQLHGESGDIIITGAPLVTFALKGTNNKSTTATMQPKEEERKDSGTVVGKVEVGNTVSSENTTSIAGSTAKITPVIKALARKLKVDLSSIVATGNNGFITQTDVRKAVNNDSQSVAVNTPAQKISTATDNPLSFKASPAVRALAGRLGVNLASCQNSGRKGSITREDVKQVANKPVSASSSNVVSNSPSRPQAPTVNLSGKPEPVRGAKRAMAQAMAASHANVVPVTLMDDASISHWPKGTDATARMLRALSYACKVVPALNASFDGEKMERTLHPMVHVGIAVDTPAGLYVPVIKNVDTSTAEANRAELNRLMASIETKSIKPNELAGGTISLSNFGTIAGRYGTPVVTLPQVAILGTGRYRDELKLTDTGISKQRMLPLSLSFDHRACTGGEGARFLAAVIEDLQSGD